MLLEEDGYIAKTNSTRKALYPKNLASYEEIFRYL